MKTSSNNPWVPVLIFALVGLVLTVAMCIIIAILDQERINAIPRPEPRVRDFVFYERVAYKRGGRVMWKRGATVVWTIYSVIGPDDGCAISKGE